MLRAVRVFFTFLLGVALLSLLLLAFHRPLLSAAGRFLIVADPLEHADVIVVLSGGQADERVRQAAVLFKGGLAPLILLSGGESLMGISVPDLLRRQARAHGVPASALLYEVSSTSTADQARFLRPLLEDRGVRRAIVVTSSYHTRRTRLLFRRTFAGSPVDIRVSPVQQDLFRPEEWWTRDQDTETVVLEYIKLTLALIPR
ncbi:MAG: YdcF family protein [bacterium]